MKKLFCLFILLNSITFAYPYKNLKEIKSGNVRIIFSEELKEEANVFLSFIKYQNENISYIGKEKIDIPIILHPYSLISNAFVTTMPFRSEIYMTPPLNSYSLGNTPWLQDLSIHEYRHALQKMEGRDGINKIFYIFGGELLVDFYNGIVIPDWYWEGDAVSQETALTLGGRGRLNYFLKDYRYILDNDIEFSYEKAKSGSYKDYIPDHYRLGYLLTSYGSEVHGPYKMNKSFSEGIRYKHILPFSGALKSNIGLSSKKLYKSAKEYYKNLYSSIDGEVYPIEGEKVEVPSTFGRVFNYDNNFYTYKESYEEIGKFEGLYTGDILKKKTISLTDDYSYNRGYLLWDSYEADKLWNLKDYSNITIYNIKEDKLDVITKNGTYFTPSLANTIDFVVVNKINMGKSSLVILNFNGEEIFEYKNGENHYNNPLFSVDDKYIYSIKRNNKGEITIVSINIDTKEEKNLLDEGRYIIEDLYLANNQLYFSAQFDLVDNIYTLKLENNEIFKLTNSKYGAYNPSVINNKLYFTEYENGSYLVKSSEIKEEDFTIKELNQLEIYNFDYFNQLGGEIAPKVQVENFEEEDYSYLKNMINPHSWSYGLDGEKLAFSVMSTNELSDLFLNYTFIGDLEEDNVNILGVDFERYWPKLSLYYNWIEEEGEESTEIEGTMSFLINMSKNYRFRHLEPSLSMAKAKEDNIYKLSFSYQSSTQKAYKNLGSNYSDSLNISYINNFDNVREKIKMDGHLGTRGIGKNDKIKLSFAYKEDRNKKKYTDNFDYTRGYRKLKKKFDIAKKLSFDYSMPLLYPDFGDNGFFLKRVKATLFYDKGLYEREDENIKLDSTGVEVYFDTTILSLREITIGFRYNYRLDDKKNIWQLVIPLQTF